MKNEVGREYGNVHKCGGKSGSVTCGFGGLWLLSDDLCEDFSVCLRAGIIVDRVGAVIMILHSQDAWMKGTG